MKPEFDLTFPASSANLGPGFDTLALAMSFGLRVRARVSDVDHVSADGRDAALCADMRDHLILRTCREILAAADKPATALALTLDNAIPLGRGCGSSAAARLAGAALAAHFGGLGWSSDQVFAAAARAEGHADNVAACWWGGLMIASDPPVQINGPWPWSLLLAIAPQPLATAEARAVLPASYARRDVVANLQSTALLAVAWQTGRRELLAAAMQDRLHQPYRAALCPLLPALAPLAGRKGVLGCALSGAGPSVIMVVDRPDRARAAAQRALEQAGLQAELVPAQIARHGPGLDWRKP